jgi:hypothetical protein
LFGADARGLPRIQKAIASQTAMGYRNWLSWFISMLVEGLLLEGRVVEAEQEAERAMAMAREGGERRIEATLYRLLGAIALRRESEALDAARTYVERGLALATEIGARWLIAECRLDLGRLYCRAGDRVRGQAYLASATAEFRNMGMTYWLEKAEAEMRELE